MSNRVFRLVGFVVVATGCNPVSIVGNIPQPVAVDVAFWGSVLEVGSVSRVCAFGIASSRVAVATQRVESWTLSDPTIAQVDQMPDAAERFACIVVRPLRAGSLTVTARMAGLDGTSTVRLIPSIGRIVIAPAAFTLREGDTASIGLTVIATNGDTLRNLPFEWRESDYGVIANVVSYGAGATTRSVLQGLKVGANTITAAVATSRRDSAANVKGQALVTVLPGTISIQTMPDTKPWESRSISRHSGGQHVRGNPPHL